MKRIILIIAVFHYSLFTIHCFSQPTIQWEVCLGGTGVEEAYTLCQTNDGGYIVAGISNSTNGQITNSHGGIWVVKLSDLGAIQWQKTFGGSCYCDNVYSIFQTTDGGYIFGGQTGSSDGDVVNPHPGSMDAWVVKLNDTGAIQWSKCYGGTGNDGIKSIKQTNDGGYIFGGSTNSHDGDISFNYGGYDAWVVKIDSSGFIQWQKTYGGTSSDGFNSIFKTNGGGYIMAGSSASSDGNLASSGYHSNTDCWVLKINDTGAIQWSKCFGGDGLDVSTAIIQSIDGGYVFTGQTGSTNGDVTGDHGGFDYWMVKLNDIGSIQWQHCYGGTDEEIPFSVIQSIYGGYLICGQAASNDGDVSGNHGFHDYWIVKTDTVGIIQWSKCYGGNGDDNAFAMIQTVNGSLVIAGLSGSTNGDVWGNHGNTDYWVVKLNPYNVGIEEIKATEDINIYPNPASTTLTLHRSTQSTNSTNQLLTITDVFGRIVFSQLLNQSTNPTESTNTTIDISTLSNGIYFYEVRGENETARGKFVVQH